MRQPDYGPQWPRRRTARSARVVFAIFALAVFPVLVSGVETRAAGSTVLVGDQQLEAQTDENPAGMAEAFKFTATAGGTVDSLAVYLDASNTASQVVVGLYDANNANPGSLLVAGTITNPLAGNWNTVSVPGVTVTAGATYWIAVLGPASKGIARFRDRATGTAAQASAQTSLSTLPATWTPGTNYANSPISAYAAGGSTATGPVISGVNANSITPSAATITWTTNTPTTSQVRYGATTTYGASTTLDTTLVTSHSQTLNGLNATTTYHYQVMSTDVSNITATSADATFTTTGSGSNAATIGQWSADMPWPLVAVHAELLDTGQVLMWDAWERNSAPSARLWDPATQTFTSVPDQYSAIFCAGQAALADGRILVVGGFDQTSDYGIPDLDIFNPATQSWSRGPDMSLARWYPTSTTLGDGRALVLGGEISPGVFALTPELYDPNSNTVSQLSGAQLNLDEYPQSYLLPNGTVFVAAGPDGRSRILNIATQSWTTLGVDPANGGSSVMFLPGQVLMTGGGDPSQATTAVIDLTTGSPAWTVTAPMAYGRNQHNLVIMPDGKVLAIGGASTASLAATPSQGILPAEVWDPGTRSWSTMAPITDPRMYHSIAMLLPDGRVLVAGGGRLGGATDFPTAQIYSPPYLFKGTRPTITSAPTTTTYGATMSIQTPNVADIASVSLVRLASVTHSLDMDQRYIPLSYTANGGSLTITAPGSANVAPPGYYMIFIVNSQGVPSVARIVQIPGPSAPNATTPPTVTLTAPGAGAVVSGTSVTAAATATDPNNGSVTRVQFLLDGAALGAPDTTAPYAVVWDSTQFSNGNHTLSAQAVDAAGNVGASAMVTAIVSNQAPGPVITAVNATSVTTSGATVTWTTSSPATSQVRYGTTTTYSASTTVDASLVTSHSQTLTGLSAGMTYHYQVVSTDAAGTATSSTDAVFVTTSAGTGGLVGDQKVEAQVDDNAAGTAEAFKFTATTSGTVSSLVVYLNSNNAATQVVVGLYANSGADPGTLLTQGVFTSPKAGAWNTVPIPPVTVTAGTTYWIAVLGPAGKGTIRFRDTATGTNAQTSAQSTLTALPATWTRGSRYMNSPISAYAFGP
jgi:hypothetical protein